MDLKYTSISNLLLLPKNFCVKEHDQLVNDILESHPVFKQLYLLEHSTQPTLGHIEKNGLMVSSEWFKGGLDGKRTQLTNITAEINQYIDGTGDAINVSRLNQFWKKSDLPIANSFDALSKYKRLHPTYGLMLKYKKLRGYLNQWSERLKEKGTWMEGTLLIKGNWQSFSSYTGRMTAKDLPLTSLPTAMREYIVSPKGNQIVSLDLNNAELRFLAHYARCDPLIQQFNAGRDVHDKTSKLIKQSMNNHDVNEEQSRNLAKQYTYSFLYGAGVQKINKNLQKVFQEITSADVVNINEAFIYQYPEIQEFLLERESNHSLLTPFGEVEPVAEFHRTQRRNFTLQSSVSVAIKLLMKVAHKQEITIVHILHDEIWILAPSSYSVDTLVEAIIKEFKMEMQNIFPGFPDRDLLAVEKIGGQNNGKNS